MFYYLYQITNLLNNRFYIGIRKTPKEPLIDGYMGSGKLIKDAIKKYGKENFRKDIIKLYDSYKELINSEIEFLTEEFINLNKGIIYNLKPGGFAPCKDSQTRGDNISKSKKGKKLNPEHRQNILNGIKNNPLSEIRRRKKIGDDLRGRKQPPRTVEQNRRNTESHKGKKQSKELILKRVNGVRNSPLAEIRKQKNSNSMRGINKGKKHSEETNRNNSEKHKGLIYIRNLKIKKRKMVQPKYLEEYLQQENGWEIGYKL